MYCNKIVKTTAIKTDGAEVMTLEVPEMELHHGQCFRICFAQNPPKLKNSPLPVNIKVGNKFYQIVQSRTICAFGAASSLYTDQLDRKCNGDVRPRQFIDLVYSVDTELFNYVSPKRTLCRPNVSFPPVTVAEPKGNIVCNSKITKE